MNDYNDLSVEELLVKVFEKNPDAAVDIFFEFFQKDWQYLNAMGELRENKEFNLKMIEKLEVNNGFFRFFFQFPPNIRDDKDIAIKCIKKSGMAFKYFSDRLKSDRDLALLLARRNPSECGEVMGEIGKEIRYIPINQVAAHIESLILLDELQKEPAIEKKENRKLKL
jgi:hypothetical protein